MPLWVEDVELDAFVGTLECYAPDHQDHQHHVRERRREVDDLEKSKGLMKKKTNFICCRN